MKKNFKRFLSVFLAVLMVITVIPMGAYAAETEETEIIQVSELEESRDLYSKTYETSENTNVVISAAVPLHYEEDGELKEIDNTLVKSETDSSILTNTANVYNVELPKKYTDDSEIKVDYEGNSVSFKLINDVKSSKGNIAKTEKADVDETNAESVAYAESNMDKLSSSITYENIIPDTNFEYNVQPDALKENIILNKVPDENYNIQYELSVGSLEAILNDDNSISLFDGDNEVFTIEAPYMIDANDVISENVTVALEKAKNAYVLTYTPDYSWISSENTAYPVTIDPTIKTLSSKTDSIIEDACVSSNAPNAVTTGSPKTFTISEQVPESKISYNRIVYYNLKSIPTIPTDSKLINLNLNIIANKKYTSDVNLYLNKMKNSIDNKEFSDNVRSYSYNSRPSETDFLVDFTNISKANGTTISFDLTNIAEELSNSTTANIFSLSTRGSTEIQVCATQNSTKSKVPYISAEYISFLGINDNSQYSTQEVGQAGEIYINELTGQLTHSRTAFTSEGAAGEIIIYTGNSVNSLSGNEFGENVSFNYYKTLVNDNSNNDIEYVVTEGDGSKRYISKNEYDISKTDTTVTISHIDNENTINETFTNHSEDSSDDAVYELTSYSIQKEHSNNENKSVITIVNDKENNSIKIKDEINMFDLAYDENKLIYVYQTSVIEDENSEEYLANRSTDFYENVDYYYYNENDIDLRIDLKDIYDKTNSVSFMYDDNNNLTQIIDETGKYYEYTYNTNNQVVKVQEFSAGKFDDDGNFIINSGTAGEYLTFEYGNNTTTISDGKNTYTEYFDLAGNLVSIVDQDGNATFAQYKNNLISKISQTRNSARNIADFYGFESGNDSFFKTNDGTVTVSSNTKFNGKSSVQLTAPAQTEAVFRNEISHLESNSTYTVSMWVYKDKNTDCALTLTNGDKSGIFTTVNSQTADGWQHFYCTIDTEKSNNLNIALTVNNSESKNSSTVFVDNMYVQKSPYLTNVNLLENGDFTDNLSNWVTDSSNITLETESANISTADDNRLKIAGDYLSEKTITQTVPITATKEGTKYTYGGWIKAVDTLPEKDGTDREISLSVYGITSNGTTSLLDKTTYSSYLSNWQYIESELALPNDNITQLKFVISNNYQTGYVMFDGLSLSQDELYTTEFIYSDEDEKLITGIKTNGTTISLLDDSNTGTENDSKTTTDTKYDAYGNVTKITETLTNENDNVAKSIVSKFEYGNNGSLLTKEMNELGRWTEYKYDYFGNIASIKEGCSNNPTDDTENNTVKDANGNTVEYEYDNFQNLSAIINQFESRYIKCNDRETTSAESYTLKVQYTYTGNRLDSIETGNVEKKPIENSEKFKEEFTAFNTYVFNYDAWGNMTKVFINDMKSPYIQYEYDETNYHQLNSIIYANGQELHYVYDDDGNIIYAYDSANTDGETLSYSYYYYDDGTCYGKKDNIAKTIESYQDGLTTVKDFSGNTLHVYGYDTEGNLLEQIGSNYIEEKETTNSNASELTTKVNSSSNVVSTEYDEFGRISSEKLGVKDSNKQLSSYILRVYTYYDNTDDNDELLNLFSDLFTGEKTAEIDPDVDTTNLVRYLTYYYVDENENKKFLEEYRYLYYVNGNTLTYTVAKSDGGTLKDVDWVMLNAYNESGMALSGAGSGILYEYDSQGNITKVMENSEEYSELAEFSYDSENSGTALKNCLTNIIVNIQSDDIESLDFDISYDDYGNIKKVSSDSINVSIDDNTSVDICSMDLTWSRGSTLTNITANLKLNYEAKILGVTVPITVPFSIDLVNYQYDDNNLRTNKTVDLSLKNINISSDLLESLRINESDILEMLGYDESNSTLADATINYTWRDGLLVGEDIDCKGSLFDEKLNSNEKVNEGGTYNTVILYDQYDNAYGFVLNKTKDSDSNEVNESETFYYLKDADNTIKAIIDEKGNKLVTYTYDSYGYPIIKNAVGYRYLIFVNPLVYRDYVYDIESGMYYLQSRYYAPYIGRFISPDSMLDTGSGTAMCTHLYSYCENDPVNNVDPSGTAYISNKSLRNALKGLLVGLGLNPLSGVAVVCIHYSLKALKTYIIAKATKVAAWLGSLINVALAIISAALAIVISGVSASTIARALIEGKGIYIGWAYTKNNRIYGITVSIQ